MTTFSSRSVLLATTLLLLAQSAIAATTFLLDLRGQATHEKDGWECLSCTDPNDPRLQPETFEWVGVLTLVTTDDEDGIYYGGGMHPGGEILSLSLDSNLYDFVNPWAATAVVSDGQVVSLDAYFEDFPIKLWLAGMTATYGQAHVHHFGPTYATAIVTNVPEPSSWALMALGLGAAAVAMRRRALLAQESAVASTAATLQSVQITFLRAPAQLS
jgi:hypothetical protein